MTKRRRAQLTRWTIYAVTVALLAAVAFFVDWARLQDKMFRPDLVREQFPEIALQAARNTLIFTFFGFSGGLVLGLGLALLRISPIGPYRGFAAIYIDVIRGLPALLVLIFIAFGLPIALGVRIPVHLRPR